MTTKAKSGEATNATDDAATPAPAAIPAAAAIPAPAAMSAQAAATQAASAANASKGIEMAVSNLKDHAAEAAAGRNETQAKMKEGMDKAMKTAEELLAFNQGNLEAMMKCGQIWSAGMQDLSRQMAATAQASFEETVTTFKAFSGVKSLKDAMDLQATLARSTLEKTFSESGRLTDASFKLAEQSLAPLTARMTLAVERFAKPV